ncbi:MAG: hypothetical protein WCP52_01770 [Bacteroidota bacterium]
MRKGKRRDGILYSENVSGLAGVSSSDKSGNKNKIKVATTGITNETQNQTLGFRPSRFAIFAVMMGMLSRNSNPILINNTAPIFIE